MSFPVKPFVDYCQICQDHNKESEIISATSLEFVKLHFFTYIKMETLGLEDDMFFYSQGLK
jgi:hypothetical protein